MSGEMMLFPATVEEFMEQYKVVDRDHALSNGTEFVPVFRMRQWFDHLQAPPLTNADRIRAMTDEELAEFINGVEAEAIRRAGLFITVGDIQRGKEGRLDWLKEEAT